MRSARSAAQAQQPKKIPRIGYPYGAALPLRARIEAFRQGLRELGYVEGKNIVIEWRYCRGKTRSPSRARGRASASQGRRHRHSWSDSNPCCEEATTTIPIVYGADTILLDGFVASLARPGGNITGLSTLAPELSGKRLELLKEIVPKSPVWPFLGLRRIRGYAQLLKEIELAAAALAVEASIPRRTSPKDIETAFRAASKGRADAVLVWRALCHFSANTDCRTCGKEPAASDVQQSQNLWMPVGL